MTLHTDNSSPFWAVILFAIAPVAISDVKADESQQSFDKLCNYCEDFSVSAAGQYPITSSYIPGVGYPSDDAPRLQTVHRDEDVKKSIAGNFANN